MKIIFVRHGDPDYVHDTLTDRGVIEAAALAKRISKLNVKQFYCSPLGRAKDTAAPTLKMISREALVFDWLREFPGYIIDPKTNERRIPWDLMPSFWTADKALYDKDEWIKTPLMQSGNVEEIYNNACFEMDKLIASYGYVRENNIYRVEKENTDTIVIFCHFGIESVLLSHILGMSPLHFWQSFVALPTSVTTIVTEEREQGIAAFRCLSFGDLSHLYAEGIEPSFAARFCETFSNKDERH